MNVDTTKNFLAVVGRLHGDDEDQCVLFSNMTVIEARQAFINEMREEADTVAGYETANVYITHVLHSRDEIVLEE